MMLTLGRPAFGAFYAKHVEALTGSTEDAEDPDKVARACYGAAIIYAAFTVFCGMQVGLFLPYSSIFDQTRYDVLRTC